MLVTLVNDDKLERSSDKPIKHLESLDTAWKNKYMGPEAKVRIISLSSYPPSPIYCKAIPARTYHILETIEETIYKNLQI